MKNNVIQVKLWDKLVGLLSWNESQNRSTFVFDKEFVKSGLNIAPFVAPLNSTAAEKGFPIIGNKEKLYSGLPEFIADSLPDRWGNVVFQKWIKANHLSAKDVNAVDRLAFIGKRAMGALEYFPAHVTDDASVDLQLNSLYELANKLFDDRQDTTLDFNSGIILEDLYKVGTSAGGQRPKAIIAIDEATDTVRSGQADLPQNFKHYILKFDTAKPKEFPFTKVEMAYYLMAKDAGINMMPSRLIDINGTKNFLTERFDRCNGIKLHTQTLAAMTSLADSYEDLFVVGRRLGLTATEQEQQYRRMVFNIVAENVDDHTKNFSFVMRQDGRWKISPAYDIIFSVDPDTVFNRNHELSVLGKRKNITKQDLVDFADKQDIKNAVRIISEITDTVMNFKNYADLAEVDNVWTNKIEGVLRENYMRNLSTPSCKI